MRLVCGVGMRFAPVERREMVVTPACPVACAGILLFEEQESM